MQPMSEAQSVGTANYREMFLRDPQFYQSLKVTAYFVILVVPISQITALAVAVLMNVKVRGIAVYRTIFFIPSLIAASVVGGVIWRQMCNNEYGILNVTLRHMLAPVHLAPPDWFGKDAAHWSVPGFVLLSVGLAILTRWTVIGSYVAAAWLVAIAANLVVGGAFLDVAVRDLVMATAAYTLARLTEARESTRAPAAVPIEVKGDHGHVGRVA